jgi:D-3-phosphoglycerate dehydrogenase
MEILAVGDSYLPADVMRRGLQPLGARMTLRTLQLDEGRVLTPMSRSQRCIREFAGDPAQVAEHLGGVEVLCVHAAPVTDEVLAAGASLRLVACARGGPVNVDVEAATARGLPVVCTPGKNAEAVADLTLGLIVMLARRLPRALRHTADGRPIGASVVEGAEFFGRDLGGLTLGLVGYGRVAQRVAGRAVAFGMDVVAFDPYRRPQPDDVAAGVRSLEELLQRADVVSVHARATPDNAGLFDAGAFARMRPGALFVNTARETLVDETALDAALAAEHLGGAALDVVHPLADGGRHPLLRHDNVVVLPHIGGATQETLLRGMAMLADAVTALQAGEALPHLANPQVLEPA